MISIHYVRMITVLLEISRWLLLIDGVRRLYQGPRYQTYRGQLGPVENGEAGSGRAAYGYRVIHQLDANGDTG